MDLSRGDKNLDLKYPTTDLGLVVLLVLVIGMFMVSLMNDGDLPIEDSNVEKEAPSVIYDVRSQGVFPYEHTVEPGEKIGIYNEIDEDITLYSDTAENRTIEPDEQTVYSLDRISYFEVSSSNSRIGSLKVNVQRP